MKPCRILILVFLLLGSHLTWSQTYPSHSPLAGHAVYRVRVAESGIYKITPSDIPALTGMATTEVALLGNSGAMLSETNGAGMAHPLYNLPVWIEDNNHNGYFDSGDYLLFFGEGTDRWVIKNGTYQYVRHAYASSNCYFLVLHTTGRAIDTLSVSDIITDTLDNHIVTAVHHNDMVNLMQSGQIWLGERFSTTQTSRTFTLTLPTAAQGATVYARYALANDGNTDASFSIAMNGQSVSSYVNKTSVYRVFETQYPSHSATTYSLQCNYTPVNGTASAYLDFIELTATASMRYNNRPTWIRTLDQPSSTPTLYRITNGSNSMRVWDITHLDSIYETLPVDGSTPTLFPVRDGGARQILLFESAQALRPLSIESITAPDLAGVPTPDMVIIAPESFSAQAERLADLHRTHDGLRVLTTTPQAVFDEYSGGKQDPLAFRELLRGYAKNHSGQHPQYLLLLGKGTYDPRGILGDGGTTVVTCEAENSFSDNGNSYCSDDMMGYLDDGESGRPTESIDVGIGRLPVSTAAEATHIVDKIERYITHSDLLANDTRSDWHNNIVLLADDADPGSTFDTIFAHDAEKLATRIKSSHSQYNISRVFADAFVQQSGSSGSFYPDVSNALKQQIDYGCLLLDYIGHGSTQYIGTERYITPNDIESYENRDRLTFFVTSTCSFGRCDLIDDLCGAERFLLADGGGIGLVTATRPIVHHENFNTRICTALLDSDNTMGDAWRIAKNSYAVSHSIILLADPALRLAIPEHQVEVTHINHQPVDTTLGDTATVLSEVLVAGHILDANGFEDNSFNGVLYITVYDRETESRTLANDNEGTSVRFMQQKNILFRSRDSVRNGLFQYRFVVPMDVAYDYAASKLSHYAHNSERDASGAYTHLFIGGFDTNQTIGHQHPTVRLYLNDTTFRSGGSSDEHPTLLALLSDSVGINAVGSGLGHDITATLNNNGNSTITLNDFYTADIADSRRGTVRYQLTGLTEGWHTLQVKAWNIFNQSGSASIRFYVQNGSDPEVIQFNASPNPATTRTTIRVEHNCPTQLDAVTVELYDMRGRLLRSWEPNIGDSYVAEPVEWDFRDSAGQPVPNGIYMARLRYTLDGEVQSKYTRIVKTR